MSLDQDDVLDLQDQDDEVQLHSGDEVYWNDPDEGRCSRHLTIQSITFKGDVIVIVDQEGQTLECFAHELS